MASKPEIRAEIVERLQKRGGAIYTPNWEVLHKQLCPSATLSQFKLAFNSLVYNRQRRMIEVRRATIAGLYTDRPRSIFARLISS